MELTINGEKKDAGGARTLDELIERMGLSELSKGIAVAVNGAVVPKGRWKNTTLETGDNIEVIHAVQGG